LTEKKNRKGKKGGPIQNKQEDCKKMLGAKKKTRPREGEDISCDLRAKKEPKNGGEQPALEEMARGKKIQQKPHQLIWDQKSTGGRKSGKKRGGGGAHQARQASNTCEKKKIEQNGSRGT